MTGIETIQAQSDSDNTTLSLRKISPVSAMIQMAYTYKSKAEPTTQNGNASFPQQLSLFLGGEITPKIGGFVQVTYADQDGGFGLDNSDLRYANQTELADQDLIYGVTINNNPTVQDLWNSTPAWGFPYASSSTAPTPAAATLIEGGLAQNVAGLGLYSLWDNLLYTEISVYRSAQQGAPNPPDNTSEGVISSLAPYWRLALQKQFDDYYVELGTYGMHTNEYLNGTQGLTDKYTDIGFDLNVEKPVGDDNMFTAHTSWIHENRNLDATFNSGGAANKSGNLNSFKIVGNYYLHSQIGFSLGYFLVNGDADNALYPAESVSGSINGKPDSGGYILELDYLPWLNTKFGVQYVAYNKFNGSSSNYDGSGRNASDNNTLYLSGWMAF